MRLISLLAIILLLAMYGAFQRDRIVISWDDFVQSPVYSDQLVSIVSAPMVRGYATTESTSIPLCTTMTTATTGTTSACTSKQLNEAISVPIPANGESTVIQR